MRIWKLMDPPLLPLTELFAPRLWQHEQHICPFDDCYQNLPSSLFCAQEQLLIDKLVSLYENVFHD